MKIENPFLNENQKLIKEFDKDIEKLITKEYNWTYYKWIPLYLKYKNKFSSSYFNFKKYDIFYDEETQIFEKDLLKIMKNYKRILDFGCGTCKIWRNNLEFIKKHKIHCIDLCADTLSYPKYILKNYNIKITNENLFNLNIKNYDCVLFSEVIMQIDDFESIVKYLVDNNPKITIIANHTIYSPFISKILTPIKNKLMKYIPIMKLGYGRALTYDQTLQMFINSGCKLEYTKKIFNNKIIFVFKKGKILNLKNVNSKYVYGFSIKYIIIIFFIIFFINSSIRKKL